MFIRFGFLGTLLSGCLLLFLFVKFHNVLRNLSVAPSRGPPLLKLEPIAEHPVKTLVEKAEKEFDQMLNRQSDTYKQATAEYRRRYGRPPPPGFDHWYEYAIAEKSPIIDDFDVVERAIEPFLALSGAEVAKTLQEAQDDRGFDTWSCRVESGRMMPGCEHLGEENLRVLADLRILSHLPNMEMLINALDEPRVLLLGRKPTSRVKRGAASFQWTDKSHREVWKEVVAKQCKGSTYSSRNVTSNIAGLPLVQDIHDAKDLCQHPEYEHMHGFWESPTTFKMTNSPVPLLSPAVLSTMSDIPFPGVDYNSGYYSYDANEDIPWEQKSDGLYWAGKTTGGFHEASEDDHWIQHHRQRFVSLANDIYPRSHAYFQRASEELGWKPVIKDLLNADTYHVYFTDVVQCENDETCNAVRDYFGVHEADPRSESFKYTLNFDLDGNGHSARFYRLLASNSLPLKQTVFKEWHDDRLIPWVHYVPISLAMDELPEVVRYLTEEEEGKKIARKLAVNGQVWSRKALKPVVYLYRLMLELAMITDPDRKAGES
ncbi:Beta-1,2-xylosyltransferase 1 [Pseudocercospora fuligena]|uniref:Beta-1,2-xylosyltransferase 1 n=1 Tax=Pseudocercospora fuligena TaxID=685502 RepID=A0A8H6RCT6_9PEZI|nr:Beta-1,2-xylosyltransferase 1 [Pseudocercospora fuligena]